MNDWQVVPKRRTINGLKFRLHGKTGNKLTVYIGSGLHKGMKGYSPDGYCNVYRKGNSLMVQLVCEPDSHSRRLGHNVFSLPYSLVSKHWQNGKREIEVPAKVEKDSLILVDLKDLGR